MHMTAIAFKEFSIEKETWLYNWSKQVFHECCELTFLPPVSSFNPSFIPLPERSFKHKLIMSVLCLPISSLFSGWTSDLTWHMRSFRGGFNHNDLPHLPQFPFLDNETTLSEHSTHYLYLWTSSLPCIECPLLSFLFAWWSAHSQDSDLMSFWYPFPACGSPPPFFSKPC